MFTWSVERAAFKAGNAVGAGLRQVLGFTLAPLLDYVYPPSDYGRLIGGRCEGCGETPLDCPCGADQLTEYEEQNEVHEPHSDCCCCEPCLHVARKASPAASAGDGPSEVDAAFPPAVPSEGPTPITFVDWATPAICTALDGHEFLPGFQACSCHFDGLSITDRMRAPHMDKLGWLEHVAPLIADHLEMAIDKTNVFELNRVNSTPVK